MLEGHRSVAAAFEAVDVLWSDDIQSLVSFLDSEVWSRAWWQLAGFASGVARLAATPLQVV